MENHLEQIAVFNKTTGMILRRASAKIAKMVVLGELGQGHSG